MTALALLGCMAGTGTDTENGVYVSAHVIDASGSPVANVNVTILDLATRADSTLTNPLYEEDASLMSDQQGRVHFYLKKNGVYMASGKRGDSVVFIDTLRTRNPASETPAIGGLGHPEFEVESPVRAHGRIRFHSGLKVDSGRVLLRGTRIVGDVSDSGTYNLGWLPPSSQKTTLTVAYQGRAREVRYVKMEATKSGLTLHASAASGQCLTDSVAVTTPVSPALTLEGSPATADMARLVGKACAHHVGALVRVLETDHSGRVLRTRGSYVIPDPDAPNVWEQAGPNDGGRGSDMARAAVPSACVEEETNLAAGLTGRATLGLANGEIVVNDFRDDRNCLK